MGKVIRLFDDPKQLEEQWKLCDKLVFDVLRINNFSKYSCASSDLKGAEIILFCLNAKRLAFAMSDSEKQWLEERYGHGAFDGIAGADGMNLAMNFAYHFGNCEPCWDYSRLYGNFLGYYKYRMGNQLRQPEGFLPTLGPLLSSAMEVPVYSSFEEYYHRNRDKMRSAFSLPDSHI